MDCSGDFGLRYKIIHKVAPRYWLWWRGVVGNAFRMKRSYSTPGPVSTAMGCDGWLPAGRNCCRLSHVPWALAQISCFVLLNCVLTWWLFASQLVVNYVMCLVAERVCSGNMETVQKGLPTGVGIRSFAKRYWFFSYRQAVNGVIKND